MRIRTKQPPASSSGQRPVAGGQIGDRRASVPVISCAPMPSTDAMERRRREPPFSPVSKPARSSPLRRRIGPRPRHDSRPWPPASRRSARMRRSADTSRAGPRNNRVLEGWEHQLHAAEAAPCVREAGGQGRLSCRARGPVVKVTAGFKGAGVSKEGPRSFVRPLFGRSTAKRSNEGVAGGLRPPASAEGGAAFGRRVGRPSAGRFRCRGRWPLPGGVQGPKAPARVDRLRRSGPAARASGEIVLIHDAHALADQRAGGGVGLFHVHRDHVAALRRRQQRIHVVHVDLGGQQHAEQAAQFHARR
jgi:hypothetical protein